MPLKQVVGTQYWAFTVSVIPQIYKKTGNRPYWLNRTVIGVHFRRLYNMKIINKF